MILDSQDVKALVVNKPVMKDLILKISEVTGLTTEQVYDVLYQIGACYDSNIFTAVKDMVLYNFTGLKYEESIGASTCAGEDPIIETNTITLNDDIETVTFDETVKKFVMRIMDDLDTSELDKVRLETDMFKVVKEVLAYFYSLIYIDLKFELNTKEAFLVAISNHDDGSFVMFYGNKILDHPMINHYSSGSNFDFYDEVVGELNDEA